MNRTIQLFIEKFTQGIIRRDVESEVYVRCIVYQDYKTIKKLVKKGTKIKETDLSRGDSRWCVPIRPTPTV